MRRLAPADDLHAASLDGLLDDCARLGLVRLVLREEDHRHGELVAALEDVPEPLGVLAQQFERDLDGDAGAVAGGGVG